MSSLPPSVAAPRARPEALTPRAIVEELDRYIVGQRAAKRAVAVALRNRWRRQQVPPPMRDEIAPKNIMLIGPTGVGKTEIARRLAKLAGAPFVKVEASKFTEVGYVGRDVDSMVRDLAETAVQMLREEERERVRPRARETPRSACWTCLLPPAAGAVRGGGARQPASVGRRHPHAGHRRFVLDGMPKVRPVPAAAPATGRPHAREPARLLREGKLDDRMVEIDTADSPQSVIDVFSGTGMEEMVLNLKDMLPQVGRRTKRRRLTVPEALEALTEEEAAKLIDVDKLTKEAIRRAEEAGIIFIDEIDKVAGREGGGHGGGPDVSREGRAARSVAHRRRVDRLDQVWSAQDRPRAVHRGGRVPRLQAQGPDPRAAGALSHPGGAGDADRRRSGANSDRARERAHQAVHRACSPRRTSPSTSSPTR